MGFLPWTPDAPLSQVGERTTEGRVGGARVGLDP